MSILSSAAKKKSKDDGSGTNASSSASLPFGGLTNLSSPAFGSRVLFATDEWFATADNLLSDTRPEFASDLYCEQGKVMDGWETRRKRLAGHDWCIIRLGGRGGALVELEVDTAHFTGNHVPRISVEAAEISSSKDDGWIPGASERLSRGGGVRGTGQSPPSVERAEEAVRGAAAWTEILPRTPLRPGYEGTRLHRFRVDDGVRRRAGRATHVRVNYFPDGGVARIRMWGVPAAGTSGAEDASATVSQRRPTDAARPTISAAEAVAASRGDLLTLPPRLDGSSRWIAHSSAPYPHPELSCSSRGGIGLACSNRHYGVPSNLIQPQYGKDMGDGWETARHPDRPPILVKDPETGLIDSPLMDWAVLKLGTAAERGVSRVILDTKHFRGNYPESVMVEGCFHDDDEAVCAASPEKTDPGLDWFPLVPRTRLGPDAEHVYLRSGGNGPGVVGTVANGTRPVSHARVRIYPDGGLSRVRIYGEAAAPDVVGGASSREIWSRL